MIFAEIQNELEYSEFHSELVAFISASFTGVKSGLQGDSWIWVFDGDDKVAIDTFSSMKHQVKSESPKSQLLEKVISVLSLKYDMYVYAKPELESHEDI